MCFLSHQEEELGRETLKTSTMTIMTVVLRALGKICDKDLICQKTYRAASICIVEAVGLIYA